MHCSVFRLFVQHTVSASCVHMASDGSTGRATMDLQALLAQHGFDKDCFKKEHVMIELNNNYMRIHDILLLVGNVLSVFSALEDFAMMAKTDTTLLTSPPAGHAHASPPSSAVSQLTPSPVTPSPPPRPNLVEHLKAVPGPASDTKPVSNGASDGALPMSSLQSIPANNPAMALEIVQALQKRISAVKSLKPGAHEESNGSSKNDMKNHTKKGEAGEEKASKEMEPSGNTKRDDSKEMEPSENHRPEDSNEIENPGPEDSKETKNPRPEDSNEIENPRPEDSKETKNPRPEDSNEIENPRPEDSKERKRSGKVTKEKSDAKRKAKPADDHNDKKTKKQKKNKNTNTTNAKADMPAPKADEVENDEDEVEKDEDEVEKDEDEVDKEEDLMAKYKRPGKKSTGAITKSQAKKRLAKLRQLRKALNLNTKSKGTKQSEKKRTILLPKLGMSMPKHQLRQTWPS